MLPWASQATGTTLKPAITALAGLVPCAETGIRQTFAARVAARVVPGADRQQPGVLALRAGVRLQRDGGEAGDLREPALELREQLVVARAPGPSGANGCSRPNSGHVTGIISDVALSFIVHEPSGIIDCASERSRASSRLR